MKRFSFIWRYVRERLTLFLACLCLAMFFLALVLCDLFTKSFKDEDTRPWNAGSSPDVVPPGKQHKGMDTPMADGIKLSGYMGTKLIQADSIEIRKKKMGHMRIGALNSAVVRNMRILADQDFFRTTTEPSSTRPDATSGRPGAKPPSSFFGPTDQSPERIRKIKKDLLMFQKTLQSRVQKVSEVEIEGFLLDVSMPDNSELRILECGKLHPEVDHGMTSLLFEDRVQFRNKAGELLQCRSASMLLDPKALVCAKDVTIQTKDGTTRHERFSFPLSELIQEASFTKHFPVFTPASTAGGKHTAPKGMRTIHPASPKPNR